MILVARHHQTYANDTLTRNRYQKQFLISSTMPRCRKTAMIITTYVGLPVFCRCVMRIGTDFFRCIEIWYGSSRTVLYSVQETSIHLRNLISVDSPHIETRSSSSVTLSRPSSASSLKIADRSFRCASPCLWNKLPASRQPNPDHSFSHSSQLNSLSSSASSSPLSLTITPTLFHSKLKRYLFLKSFPP